MEKKRIPNFSEEEKIILRHLVSGNEIIVNKKTDSCSMLSKQEAWEQITIEFNTLGMIERSSVQLKSCWENMKKRTKNLTAKRKADLREVGVPAKKSGSLLENEQITGYVSVLYDEDAYNVTDQEGNIAVVHVLQNEEMQTEELLGEDWQANASLPPNSDHHYFLPPDASSSTLPVVNLPVENKPAKKLLNRKRRRPSAAASLQEQLIQKSIKLCRKTEECLEEERQLKRSVHEQAIAHAEEIHLKTLLQLEKKNEVIELERKRAEILLKKALQE